MITLMTDEIVPASGEVVPGKQDGRWGYDGSGQLGVYTDKGTCEDWYIVEKPN